MKPGKNPEENAIFLTVLCGIIQAVDLHSDILRATVAGAGNDHRLGANEAPPAIISIYVGDQLNEVIEQLEKGTAGAGRKVGKMQIGVDTLPQLLDFAGAIVPEIEYLRSKEVIFRHHQFPVVRGKDHFVLACQTFADGKTLAVFCGIELFIAFSVAIFALAASGDWLGLYYKAVFLEEVNGMTVLRKEYGPLHVLYTVYLISYVLVMVAVIYDASRKKRLTSFKYTMLLLAAVLLNIGVWAVEQGFNEDFEFLSVSYVVTEVILLLLYSMLRDYGIIRPGGQIASVQMLTQLNTRKSPAGELPPGMEEMFRSFAEKAGTLSAAERRILNYYIDGYDTAQIPELAFISIHTVKKHNHSINQKLEVASRDELMLYIELFRCCGRLKELTDGQTETE